MAETTKTQRQRGPIAVGVVAAAAVTAIAAPVTVAMTSHDDAPSKEQKRAQAMIEEIVAIIDAGGIESASPAYRRERARALKSAGRIDDERELRAVIRRLVRAGGTRHSAYYPKGSSMGTADRGRPQPQQSTSDGITTLKVPKMVADDDAFARRYAKTIARQIESAKGRTSCGWVVDLRGNRGGNMWPMVGGLAALLPDGDAMAFVAPGNRRFPVTVKGSSFIQGGHRNWEQKPDAAKIDQPVAILQDGKTASSGEATALMFRGLPNVRSFGGRSAGYATANIVQKLSDGAFLQLTVSYEADRTGKVQHGPIVPDEPTSNAPAAASRWLKGRCRPAP